uniref:Ribonuclease H-like domain-containing protein n=1 Tax=Tanacetum cinerariifolium TaxID=118510 RepID=A0A6L2KCY1_TANCI|nr:ribonuclease H-like domain-containing protein [Tanacetum cinerariifolium]
MGPFLSSKGNKYILVAIDYLSKWVEAKALPINDARVVCKFLKNLFARYGTSEPLSVIEERTSAMTCLQRRRVQRETTRSTKYAYESPSHRYDGHRPHGGPMRPPLRSSGHRPHGGSMRPPYRSAGHRPHGPSMNPRRPIMNGARPYKSFFIQSPSYETRPFLKSSAVKNPYRASWVPTINRTEPIEKSLASHMSSEGISQSGAIKIGASKFRKQQYLQHEHYALWEVIEVGDSYEAPQQESTTASASEGSVKKKGRTVAFTTDDIQKRRNDTFSGNEATKKTKKNLLKQQYGNFKVEEIEQDDMNQKFLTSLAPEWLMHTIIWRNRSDLDTMNLDDLYNHLKVYEPEVKKKSESNSQNMAFISSAKNNSGNEEVNTASIPTASTQVSPAGPNVATASISLDTACAYIASQSNGYWKKTRKKVSIQGTDVAGFDKSKVKCFNCHKMGHFARECRAPRSQERGRKENYRQGSKNHALVADEEAPIKFSLMAKSSFDNEVFDNSLCSQAYKNNTDSIAQVEARLVEYKSQEINLCKNIRAIEFELNNKNIKIERLTNELENAKKEKDNLDSKLTGFQSAFKDLDNLLGSQRCDKNKERPSPAIESNSDDLQNKNPSVTETGASSITILSKPAIKFIKAAERLTEIKTNKGNSQINIDDKGYWDSGCSRYMTGNISYLSDYEPFDGGYVSFGQGGCKITGKGTIKTGKLEFENVYFVKDLKTPRQHNMYSIDLNNVVPHKDLTCLVAKASADEYSVGNLNDDLSISSSLYNLTEGVSDKMSTGTALP